MKCIYLTILMVVMIGCSSTPTPVADIIEKKEIVRVFHHSERKYTVFMQEGTSIKQFTFEDNNIEIEADVAEDKPMYMESIIGQYKHVKKRTIHIHSVKDINGGDWQNGRFKSKTHVIE